MNFRYDHGFFEGLGDRMRVRRTSWQYAELIMVAYDDLLANLHDPKLNQFCTPLGEGSPVYATYGVSKIQLT